MKEFKKLTPFKLQVLENFPFIDEDFDAITNYELLCKVVEYLNKTIGEVSELTDKVNEFQNYFDNLDVQEEINNKLDEMAESGELTEIIAQYLQLAGVLAYNTVSDMKSAINLVNGSIAKTLGFHTLNDGGSASYKIRNITNDDIVDEITIISLADNNLIAELIIKDNTINLEQMGCYGDNTHDDSTNINNAISYAINNGLKIKGNKIYKIESTINVSNNLNIELNKINYSGIEHAIKITGSNNIININEIVSSNDGLLLEPTLTSLVQSNNIYIHKIGATGHGMILNATDWGILDNIIKFDMIHTTNTKYGIYCYCEHNELSSNHAYIGENAFYGGRIDNSLYGVYAKSMGDDPSDYAEITALKIYNISIEGCTNGIYFDNVNYSIIDYPRYQELDNTSSIILNFTNNTRNCVFNGATPLNITQIITTGLTCSENSYNLLNCKIRKVANGYIVGENGIIHNQGVFFKPIYKYYQETITATKDYKLVDINPEIIRVATDNNIEIHLDKNYSYYGQADFYIIKANNPGTITIYNSDGTVIRTLNATTPRTFHFGFNQEGYLITLGYAIN